MIFSNEMELLDLLQKNPDKRLLTFSGDEKIFYEQLVCFENLSKFEEDREDYILIYFYKDLYDHQVQLIDKLYPYIISINLNVIESLNDILSLFDSSYWSSPVALKFYLFKLINYVNEVYYIDYDTLIEKNIYKEFKKFNDHSYDFSALIYHSFGDKNYNKRPYLLEQTIRNCIVKEQLDISKIRYINSAVLSLNSSINKKLKYDIFINDVKDVTNNIIANNNYLSTEAVLSLIILKHNLVLKNIGVRFNFNLGMHWDGNQLKEDVVIYHFPQKSNKLYRNLSTQMSLPHSIEHLRSLQIKLQYLFDIKFITKDLYDLYENIIKKFNLIENINLPVKLANMINLLDFFRLAMPAVVSFLKKNEEFYLQPLDNDTKIMIFIKNQSNYNRITICPSVRMNCLDNRYCNFEFRISLYEKNPIKDVFLGRDEGIEAIKSFKNIFPYAQVEINDKNIYFRTFFDISNIEVWLLKFGGFYKKYLINLDYI